MKKEKLIKALESLKTEREIKSLIESLNDNGTSINYSYHVLEYGFITSLGYRPMQTLIKKRCLASFNSEKYFLDFDLYKDRSIENVKVY